MVERKFKMQNRTLAGIVTVGLSAILVIGILVGKFAASGSHSTNTLREQRSYKLFSGSNKTESSPKRSSLASNSNRGSRAKESEIKELLSQAARDLEPWKSGITLEMVERLYCVPEAIDTFRIQILNGRAYLVGPNFSWQSRFITIQRQILDVAEKYKLPDVDFIVSSSDVCQEYTQQHISKDGNFGRCPKNAPLFSFCKHKFHSSCVTMPEFSFGGWPEAFMPDWRSSRTWMLLAAQHSPFKDRKPRLFWRGGGTNMQRVIMDTSDLVKDSNVTDVHLMHWGDGEEVFKREFISLPEHCSHRQLLHLAGVAYSARLRYLMLCGSPVVFPYDYDWEPKEFWYHMLKDKENIMFTGKVDDHNWGRNVVDIAETLDKDTKLAEKVGRQGQYLAAEILHPDNIERYWVELFTQYSKLQKFQPKLHADATPLEVGLMRPQMGRVTKDRTCNVC